MTSNYRVQGIELVKSGRLVRKLRLRSEFYEFVNNPGELAEEIKRTGIPADIFVFIPNPVVPGIEYRYHRENYSIALLPVKTYEYWWTTQINDKTRNMVRKAYKSGVEIKVVELDEGFIRGIKEIYDESPVRQGKKFRHYNKTLEEIKESHISFLDRSVFIGAYYGNELIGFAKLVHNEGYSSLMQIIAKISARKMAPMNALIAKAVEICAEKGIPYLHFGSWGKMSGPNQFKKHNAFMKYEAAQYYVPLTAWGKVAIALGLHRDIKDYIPERIVQFFEKKFLKKTK